VFGVRLASVLLPREALGFAAGLFAR